MTENGSSDSGREDTQVMRQRGARSKNDDLKSRPAWIERRFLPIMGSIFAAGTIGAGIMLYQGRYVSNTAPSAVQSSDAGIAEKLDGGMVDSGTIPPLQPLAAAGSAAADGGYEASISAISAGLDLKLHGAEVANDNLRAKLSVAQGHVEMLQRNAEGYRLRITALKGADKRSRKLAQELGTEVKIAQSLVSRLHHAFDEQADLQDAYGSLSANREAIIGYLTVLNQAYCSLEKELATARDSSNSNRGVELGDETILVGELVDRYNMVKDQLALANAQLASNDSVIGAAARAASLETYLSQGDTAAVSELTLRFTQGIHVSVTDYLASAGRSATPEGVCDAGLKSLFDTMISGLGDLISPRDYQRLEDKFVDLARGGHCNLTQNRGLIDAYQVCGGKNAACKDFVVSF